MWSDPVEHVTISDIQELTVFVMQRQMHTESEHSVTSGDKGKHQKKGSQKEFRRW